MENKKFLCKYCGKKMHKIDYEINNEGLIIKLELSIYNNKEFDVLPDVLTRFYYLKELFLYSCNNLKKLLDSIKNLSSLKILNIGSEIEALPDSIGELNNLEVLVVHSNKINYLPESIGNLKKLKFLILDCFEMTVLPVSIKNLR